MGVSVLRQSGLSVIRVKMAKIMEWTQGTRNATVFSDKYPALDIVKLLIVHRWGMMKPRKRFLRGQEGVMEDDQFYRGADVVLIIVSPTCFLLFNCAYWYYYCIHCS